MITSDQANQILMSRLAYTASDVVPLKQVYGVDFVDCAINLMRKLGGPAYFDDSIRQLARSTLRNTKVTQSSFLGLAKATKRNARIYRNAANRCKPTLIIKHRKLAKSSDNT